MANTSRNQGSLVSLILLSSGRLQPPGGDAARLAAACPEPGAHGPGAAGFACLFRFVPHTAVRWRNAIAGGLLAGIAFEFGKRGFAIYLANVPTYRTIYGAFAPLLAFLVWVYYSWFITLAAALVSASLPRAGARQARRLSRA
jgi:hypothetical protein